jgi:hypothetical protein
MKSTMDVPLQTTLVDAVNFLESESVPYALVGGLAVSLRGQPRVTADVGRSGRSGFADPHFFPAQPRRLVRCIVVCLDYR